MQPGLEATLKQLTETRNEAATDVLVAALDAPDPAVRDGVFRTLVRRRSSAGHRELIRRWDQWDDGQRDLIAAHGGRMSAAIRDAILTSDSATCRRGCAAAICIREYDLIPALVNALEDKANRHRDLVAETLLRLTDLLYGELAAPRDYRNRRDPQLVRKHVLSSLEAALVRFDTHRRREVIEATLLLANRDNAVLKRLLSDPRDPAYLTLLNVLLESESAGVIRLLLSFLDDPRAPTSAIQTLARRTDSTCLRHLLKKIGFEPSANAKVNLKRMEAVRWAREGLDVVWELDDAQQHAAVQMVVRSGMNRLDVFSVLRAFLVQGKVGGRRAAAAALAEFRGADANELAQRAALDPDPQVQAHIVRQMRARGFPHAMTRLIELTQHDHPAVRAAARDSLGEFRFDRYLAAFDMLDDHVRAASGRLVATIDSNAVQRVADEITNTARTRRLRGLRMAAAMEVVAEIENVIVEATQDNDHFIRVEAIRALGSSRSELAAHVLDAAAADYSIAVQEAAREALAQRDRSHVEPESPATVAAIDPHVLSGFTMLGEASS